MRYYVLILLLGILSCRPEIDCSKFDNEGLNIKEVVFFYASDNDIDFLEEKVTKDFWEPVACSDEIKIKKPLVQRLEDDGKLIELWECLPTPRDGDIKDIKFLRRANNRGIQSIDWDKLKNNKTLSRDSLLSVSRFLLNNHTDALVFSKSGLGADLTNFHFDNVDSLKNQINTMICGNSKKVFVILLDSDTPSKKGGQESYAIAFTDDRLTDLAKMTDIEERNEKLTEIKDKLIIELEREPTDWNILYLLARSELLLNPFNESSYDQAADYLIKASHEALKIGENRELLALINKHEHEAFKNILSQETERRWKIESCKVGLKKGKKEYLSTSINWLDYDSKQNWKVNIDPDQLYNHIGQFKKFSIGVKSYNPATTDCILNFSYPSKGSKFTRDIALQKFQSKNIIVDDKISITLTNHSVVGNDFVTIGYSEKKNDFFAKKGNVQQKPRIVQSSPTKTEPSSVQVRYVAEPTKVKASYENRTSSGDSDNDGFVDAKDDCPERYSKENGGCPTINITSNNDIYMNETVSFNMNYPGKKGGDRIAWESASSIDIIAAESSTPRFKFPNVGKYLVNVSVNNYTDNFYINGQKEVYVKIRKSELESIFKDIIQYGNDGKLVKGNEEQRRFFNKMIAKNAEIAERKLLQLVVNESIPIKFRASTRLNVMLNRFKTPKSVNTTINNFRILNISYDTESGLINNIECDFNG